MVFPGESKEAEIYVKVNRWLWAAALAWALGVLAWREFTWPESGVAETVESGDIYGMVQQFSGGERMRFRAWMADLEILLVLGAVPYVLVGYVLPRGAARVLAVVLAVMTVAVPLAVGWEWAWHGDYLNVVSAALMLAATRARPGVTLRRG
ncbi:hypothetical protein ACFXJ8_12835 [Nonomuraea sp. NPDC059194]|uniref:hypothetical protein n=1 Tax=Nonomuraea sp. NPDC059194 TaxID=3346764 RepID=UPI00369C2859